MVAREELERENEKNPLCLALEVREGVAKLKHRVSDTSFLRVSVEGAHASGCVWGWKEREASLCLDFVTWPKHLTVEHLEHVNGQTMHAFCTFHTTFILRTTPRDHGPHPR